LATLLILFVSNNTHAQSATIAGYVKDAAGSPLSGASLVVEPRNIGTTTDANGKFSLKVPAGPYILSVSCVGQTTQSMNVTIKAGETAEKNISLLLAGAPEEISRLIFLPVIFR